jgi:hypothetical protein
MQCLKQSQFSLYSQLAILKRTEIIEGKRGGNEICYSVSDETAKKL